MNRRTFLLAALAAPLGLAAARAAERPAPGSAEERLAALEAGLAGRLGVAAIDTATGATLAWRGGERFPMCSTFKAVLAGAILRRSEVDAALLDRRVRYAADDLVTWSPVTEKHLDAGMTVAELCAAALQHSDNTAGNLLMRELGGDRGPEAVTDFARSLGDDAFRLDRWETALNSALPGDERDTTTPRAMADTLRRLLLGDALAEPQRQTLRGWMVANTTGDARVRAGVPRGWAVADKTGTGDYAAASDIAVAWPPDRPPVVLAIYTHLDAPDAKPRNDTIAAAAATAARWATR